MVKRKNRFKKLISANKITALAVVVLCLSGGALLLPKSDAATYAISSLTATPTNTSSYAITMKWAGSTPDHWAVRVYKNGAAAPTPTQVAKATTSKSYSNLTCGVAYHFEVAAAGPQNGIQSAWKATTATAPCPSVVFSSMTASGNTLTLSWRAGTSFTTSFTLYTRTGSGAYVAHAATSATSTRIAGACGTTYAAYLRSTMNGQTGPASVTKTVATAACPAPAPAPTPTPTPTPTPKPSTPKTTAPAPTPTPAPAAPTNFAASVVNSKVVDLSWNGSANADHYVINRSTDNTNWGVLNGAVGSSTATYKDDTADFSKTYYYQIIAVGADGQQSAPATAQATTEAFKASTNKITSQDKSITAQIPNGAIDGDYHCSIPASQDGLDATEPVGQRMILGPYELSCVTSDGKTVKSFDKPVTVTVKLASVADGFSDFTVATLQNGRWNVAKNADYQQEGQQLTFSLTSARTFAAFGTKQGTSLWKIIGLALLVFLIIAALIVALIWWQRRRSGGDPYGGGSNVDYPLIPPAAPSTTPAADGVPTLPPAQPNEITAEQEFKQALSQPDCTHLGMAQQVVPSGTGCLECERDNTHWNSLRICLTCGHVGCSDDSPQQHALKHFQETGHPLIYDYANPNGNSIGWCYIDQTYI